MSVYDRIVCSTGNRPSGQASWFGFWRVGADAADPAPFAFSGCIDRHRRSRWPDEDVTGPVPFLVRSGPATTMGTRPPGAKSQTARGRPKLLNTPCGSRCPATVKRLYGPHRAAQSERGFRRGTWWLLFRQSATARGYRQGA
jgi:hypothetical protein